ncbi:MAG: hypothetical protein OEM38_08675 [Gammaproteobacteria bacterium]|nr:hypothetical protein [Gammaproteobacteria bacterium]
MTAPILNALLEECDFRLTLRTTLPENLLRTRIKGDFSVIPETSDFGMLMHSSLDVDVERSGEAYRVFHQNYEQKVEDEAASLLAIKPDLILANIPYLTIDAAARCEIPCVAYCSLNWFEIFSHYFKGVFPEEQKIKKQIGDAYNRADLFLCPTPSMSMSALTNIENVGPIAKQNNNIIDLHEKIGCDKQTKIVLVTPGGISTPIPIESWPQVDHILWVCSWQVDTHRRDIIYCEKIDLSFNEILANCDAVITKAGYGIVTETVCNQVPVLYVTRGDWPEEPHLLKWWKQYGNVGEISRDELYAGDVIESLRHLWEMESKSKVEPSGIDDVCSILAKYIEK